MKATRKSSTTRTRARRTPAKPARPGLRVIHEAPLPDDPQDWGGVPPERLADLTPSELNRLAAALSKHPRHFAYWIISAAILLRTASVGILPCRFGEAPPELPPGPPGDAQKGREGLRDRLLQIHEARIDRAIGLAAAIADLLVQDRQEAPAYYVAEHLQDTLKDTKAWIDQVEEAARMMGVVAGGARHQADDDEGTAPQPHPHPQAAGVAA